MTEQEPDEEPDQLAERESEPGPGDGGSDDGGENRAAPGPDAESEEEGAGYKRTVAIVLALLAVLGGVISYIEKGAADNESRSARQTTRAAVQAMAANVESSGIAGLETNIAAEALALEFEPVFDTGDNVSLGGLFGAGETDEERAEELALAQEQITLEQEGEEYVFDQRVETEFLTLKQSSLAEVRVTWNGVASNYGTVLTVLGVSIFLIGFTLILSRSIRPPILVPGLIIAFYCAGWTAWIYAKPIPDTPDKAIQATAEGQVLIESEQYDDAVAAFDSAVALDEDYASPYTGRAVATFLAANPDYPNTTAVTDSSVLPDVSADAQASIDNGGSRDVVNYLVLSLVDFYESDYDDAVSNLDEVIEIDAELADTYVLRMASELALGDPDAASENLDTALGLLGETEPSRRNRILAADAYSYLEWVAHDVPDQADAAGEFIERIALGETRLSTGEMLPGEAPGGAAVEIRDFRYDTDQYFVDLGFSALPDGSTLSLFIYERPLPDGPWVQPWDLALIAAFSGDGDEQGEIAIERICEPTEVRLDVYADGAFLTSATAPGVAATC